MKRILLIICLIIPFIGTEAKRVSKIRVEAVLSECRHYEGAEEVKLGRVATVFVRGIIRLAAKTDPDAREVLSLMKDLRGVSILSFEDCSLTDQDLIIRKIDNALSGSEMLMEASDGGERVRFYGLVDAETDTVRDFVLYAPSQRALICFFGTLSVDTLSRIASHE